MNLDDVKIIFHRDKREIISKYRGTGAGIGKEGGEYVITVYLTLEIPMLKLAQESWMGVSLRFRVIGEVKKQ